MGATTPIGLKRELATPNKMQKSLFTNFTEREFTWNYNREPYVFPAGHKEYMEDWKAKFFAKHLVNRELMDSQNAHLQAQVSPANPEDAPEFMKLFTKAFTLVGEDASPERVRSEIINLNTLPKGAVTNLHSEVTKKPGSPKKVKE